AIIPESAGRRDARTRLELEAEVPAGPRGEPPLRFRGRAQTFAFVPRGTTRLSGFLSAGCGLPTTGCRTVAAAACPLGTPCEEIDRICDRGRCVPNTLVPTQGDAGTAAVVPPCTRREDCAPGLVCRMGTCVGCLDSGECAAGRACIDSVCRTCARNEDCPGG